MKAINKKSIDIVKESLEQSMERGEFSQEDLVEFINCVTLCHQLGFSDVYDVVDFINNLGNEKKKRK